MALLTRKPCASFTILTKAASTPALHFGNRVPEMGVRPSMGLVGDAYDNAMAESFFATLECELIARRKWETKAQARLAIFTWIEARYNPRRRHSGLGQMSPNNFEQRHQENRQQPAEKPHPPQSPRQNLTHRQTAEWPPSAGQLRNPLSRHALAIITPDPTPSGSNPRALMCPWKRSRPECGSRGKKQKQANDATRSKTNPAFRLRTHTQRSVPCRDGGWAGMGQDFRRFGERRRRGPTSQHATAQHGSELATRHPVSQSNCNAYQ